VRRSDGTGDDASSTGPAGGSRTVEPEDGELPAHALRERIRRANVAAHQSAEALALPEPIPTPSKSSLPPEHSGVRSRPNDPLAAATMPPPVFLPPTQTQGEKASKWPLAPADKTTARRMLAATQLGLGGPIAPTVPSVSRDAAPTASELTRSRPPLPQPPQPRGATTTPVPTVSALSAPNASAADASAASVPAPSGETTAGGARETNRPGAYRVSNRSVAGERARSFSPTTTQPERPALLRSSEQRNVQDESGRYSLQDSAVEHVDTAHSSADEPISEEYALNDPSDPASRARRYTPKQRPAHRRGRARSTTSPGRIHEERPELARTLPDLQALRTTLPGRPALPSAPSPPPAAAHEASPAAAVSGKTITKPSAPVPRRPASSKVTAPMPALEASIVIDPVVMRGPAGADAGRDRASAPPTFEPLPKDRASFDIYMQKRAAEARARGSALPWNEQETLLIPRAELPKPRAKPFLERLPMAPVLGLFGLVLVGGLAYWLNHDADGSDAVRAVSLDTTTSAAKAHPSVATYTVVATEPSGAELLHGGAVLGNTPLSVPRPTQGDDSYLVRMRGFESQLITLSPRSQEAMLITLFPETPKQP
jgi:hypothetical protein